MVKFFFLTAKLVYSYIREEQSTSSTKPANEKNCMWYSIQTKITKPKKVLGTKIHQKATTKDIPWEL
jgi:hypothetical protein